MRGIEHLTLRSPQSLLFTTRGEIYEVNFLDPNRPKKTRILPGIEVKGKISALAISGDTLFLVSDEEGLSLISLSEKKLLKNYGFFRGVNYLAISNNTLYTLQDNGVITAYGFEEEGIYPLFHLNTRTRPRGISLYDSLIFLPFGEEGFSIYQWKDDTILLVRQIHTRGECWNVIKKGRYLYIADGIRGLTVLDARNIKKPKIEGTLEVQGTVVNLAMEGDQLYLATLSVGIVQVSVKEPRHPRKIHVIRDVSIPTELLISKGTLVVHDRKNGLLFYKIKGEL